MKYDHPIVLNDDEVEVLRVVLEKYPDANDRFEFAVKILQLITQEFRTSVPNVQVLSQCGSKSETVTQPDPADSFDFINIKL